jgi:hypothetical protein
MEKVKLQQISNYIFILFVFACTNKNINSTYYKQVLGLKINVEKNKYSFEESAGNNEGFFLSIDSFSTKDKSIRIDEKYPKLKETRENWGISKWSKSPLKNYENNLEVLLKYDITNDSLKSKVFEFLNLVKGNKSYYSYYYKKQGDSIYSIEFYLIDLDKSLLYTVIILT